MGKLREGLFWVEDLSGAVFFLPRSRRKGTMEGNCWGAIVKLRLTGIDGLISDY